MVDGLAIEEDGEGVALEIGKEKGFVGVRDIGEDAAKPKAGGVVGVGGWVVPIPRGPCGGVIGFRRETFGGFGDEIAIEVRPAILETDGEVGPFFGMVVGADAEGEGRGFGRGGRGLFGVDGDGQARGGEEGDGEQKDVAEEIHGFWGVSRLRVF